MKNKSIFKKSWEEMAVRHCGDEHFHKKLNGLELEQARRIIAQGDKNQTPAREVIQRLREAGLGLGEKWEAERVYWTETKRKESTELKEDADLLEYNNFRIIPSPNACQICLEVSGGGLKKFKKEQLIYQGRAMPPIHPNCFCILIIDS